MYNWMWGGELKCLGGTGWWREYEVLVRKYDLDSRLVFASASGGGIDKIHFGSVSKVKE